jgi:hypothetical protein
MIWWKSGVLIPVFLFARNFISESLLVVGQILIIKRQAFDFDDNN